MRNILLSAFIFTIHLSPCGGLFAAERPIPASEVAFEKHVLLDKYVSEGASIGDVDGDGKPDVISGPLWWKGPDFKQSFSYAPVKYFPIQGPGLKGYSNNFFTFTGMMTKDKWADILKVGVPSSPADLAINPGKAPRKVDNGKHSCEHCRVQDQVCNEAPQFVDVVGDAKKELLSFSGGYITLAVQPKDVKKKWQLMRVSHHDNGRFAKYQHGLGAGYVNKDGLVDILEKGGWWQQPKDWDGISPWKFHAYPFAPAQGGARMFSYDVDGDGDMDVVTALNAHKYGLACYEQVEKDGKIDFKKHWIMSDTPKPNEYGVSFSQLHAMDCVDIDGDGIKDIVTGKCFFAHCGNDPGAHDPAVLYWFKTTRTKGGVTFVPHKIDSDSGVGRQISTGDLNGDGKIDIVVGNKKGVFIFLQTKAEAGRATEKVQAHAKTFLLSGPKIKYGCSGFIGWWYSKDSYATVPFKVSVAMHSDEKLSKQLTVRAIVAADKLAGGGLKLVLSISKDPKLAGIKEWQYRVKPTGGWGKWQEVTLGNIEIPTVGNYYLHFIMHQPNKEFIDLKAVSFETEPFSAIRVEAGPQINGLKNPNEAPKKQIKAGNAVGAKVKSPEAERLSFKLPKGFVAELVASEAQGLVKPISIHFDDKGQLWTQTAREYPADDNHALFKKGGRDQIIYFERPWASGLQTPKVFADGLVMPNSVLPYQNGVYAVHGPEVLYLEDSDGDGRADKKKVIVSGFGIQDTHTNIHQLTRTAGGWITFSQGCNSYGNITLSNGSKMPFNRARIGRMNPQGSVVETLAVGMNNIWCWPVSREGVTFIHEANDYGYSQVRYEQDVSYPSFVAGKRYDDAFLHPPTANELKLGGTGFSGIVISEDAERGFPKEWRGVNFVINPITSSINTVKYHQGENGAYRFEKLGDLLQSSDPMFRPVAAAFGPDGCLYVIDWYNRIISHNEVGVDHPARDKVSGRIWRIRHESQKPYAGMDMTKVATVKLATHLLSSNGWEAKAAWHQIADRKASILVPHLKKILGDESVDAGGKVHALWALESLKYFDVEIWKELLENSNANVRFEAVRALSSLRPKLNVVHSLLSQHREKSYRVLNEMVRFYRDTSSKLSAEHITYLDSLSISKSALSNEMVKGWKGQYYALGGAYEQRFLNFLIKKAKLQDRGQEGVDESKWNQVIDEHPSIAKNKQVIIDRKIKQIVGFHKVNGGSEVKGKALFEGRCASCHDASKGEMAFAPALNGGKDRAVDGIVHSVLDPNAAVESVFNTYRVKKKDGNVIEGFRSGLSEKEITIMYMGGSKVKISLSEVDIAGYVKGKSVMLENMGSGLTDQQFADLIEYVQSLK